MHFIYLLFYIRINDTEIFKFPLHIITCFTFEWLNNVGFFSFFWKVKVTDNLHTYFEIFYFQLMLI